mmetsp:Transcript_16502/g.33816  ORF Transcript_16502/g.33816 Transcript_16502/m.33816 type:complete len:139 (-) Transcript_16502:28-444(-)
MAEQRGKNRMECFDDTTEKETHMGSSERNDLRWRTTKEELQSNTLEGGTLPSDGTDASSSSRQQSNKSQIAEALHHYSRSSADCAWDEYEKESSKHTTGSMDLFLQRVKERQNLVSYLKSVCTDEEKNDAKRGTSKSA